jgi:hypothetical protein
MVNNTMEAKPAAIIVCDRLTDYQARRLAEDLGLYGSDGRTLADRIDSEE